MPNAKKIVVTGGAGFVGSHITHRLVDDGNSVFVFIKKTTNTNRLEDILSRITLCEEDLSSRSRLEKNIEKINPDGVFHFAASNIQSGVTSSDDDVIKNNLSGTVNLLSALAPIDYDFFIQTGSFLECGIQKHAILETDFPEPTDLYSISKLAATLHGQAIAKKFQKPIITLRLFTPYGPGIQKGRLVRTVIENSLARQPINLTSPSITRDFIFVDDIADLCLEVMDRAREFGGEIFNMGSGSATTLEELTREVLQITGSNSKVNWGVFQSVAYDSGLWRADMTKTFSTFSWRPKTSLSEGLTKTIKTIN